MVFETGTLTDLESIAVNSLKKDGHRIGGFFRNLTDSKTREEAPQKPKSSDLSKRSENKDT